MPLQPQRQECLTEEDEEYYFHRLGELLLAHVAKPDIEEDRFGSSSKLAVASRHGWTIYAHDKSEHQLSSRGRTLQLNQD